VLKTIRLGNFKAFSTTQIVPLRPLTIVFGPNSSGKSSLIHGLLFAHEAITGDSPGNLDVTRPRIGGDAVDLGGFRQFVHRRDAESRVEWGVTIDVERLSGKVAEILKPAGEVTVLVHVGITKIEQMESVAVQSYEIRTRDAKLLRASLKRRSEGWRLALDELETENPVIMETVRALVYANTTTDKLDESDFESVNAAIDELVPLLELQSGNFLPTGVVKAGASEQPDLRSSFYTLSKENRREELGQIAGLFVQRLLNTIVAGVNQHISFAIKKLRYLGPLRSYPSRHLAFSQEYDTNWFAGGGWAWDKVRQDPSVREKVNAWLGSAERMKTPYQLIVRDLYSSSDLEDPLWTTLEQIQKDGQDFEIEDESESSSESSSSESSASISDIEREVKRFNDNLQKANIESIKDLVLLDVNRKTIVSHRDVGIGVSQVLPVLVSAYAARGEILAMEQPELHLHPALQAELGDVFIESAMLNKNSFILETHSEHLILRLMRRIRETTAKKNGSLPPLRAEDVCLLYMRPDVAGSELVRLRLDENGNLIDPCPGGFFEEDFEEMF